MASCILYNDPSSRITIIDIPRSIEIAQGTTKSPRNLISSSPSHKPFPSLEPKSIAAKARAEKSSLDDLLTEKYLQLVLNQLHLKYGGDYCLPRLTKFHNQNLGESDLTTTRQKGDDTSHAGIDETGQSESWHRTVLDEVDKNVFPETNFFFHNSATSSVNIMTGLKRAYIPSKSSVLSGNIETTSSFFLRQAPRFDIIVMDPPWPNRSARRKRSYHIPYDNLGIITLLKSIPINDCLGDAGLVGIWITNKATFREMVIALFQEWGITLIEEWIWLKVTTKGQPICALDGCWRKPYEMLLLGKKGVWAADVQRRFIIGVPDIHSRKPNLKELIERLIEKRDSEYTGLEVFARNLTNGWWGWGQQVLDFQGEEHWISLYTVENMKSENG